MSQQQGRRPSTDRRPVEGGFGHQGNNQYRALDPNSQYAPRGADGYEVMNAPRQRFTGPAVEEENSTNGSLPPSPVDGRSGRSVENTQNLPIRERSRSRNNGGAGTKGSIASRRVCKKCGESLTGQFVRALGGTYHLDCFRCRVGHFPHSYCLSAHSIISGLRANRSLQVLSTRR